MQLSGVTSPLGMAGIRPPHDLALAVCCPALKDGLYGRISIAKESWQDLPCGLGRGFV